jgi:hypothetical protein
VSYSTNVIIANIVLATIVGWAVWERYYPLAAGMALFDILSAISRIKY